MIKKERTRRQRAKKYSVIVIPDSRAKVWRWEISRKMVEAGLGFCLTLVLILTGSIWGFAHYRNSYLVTEDVRLQNAKFEEERAGLLTKLAGLEQAVERTARYANRLESSMGVNSGEMQKGIGPLAESDFAEVEPAAVKNFDNLKFGREDSRVAFDDLNRAMGEMESTISGVDDRLHAVYELHRDHVVYWSSLPSIWPTKGWVTSGFGSRRQPLRGGTTFHKGLDIAAPPGTPILCPGDGVVTYSGYKRGMGLTVMVDHGYGVVTVYGHTSKSFVKEGDHVKRGELVGSVGRTGLATGSHLHYQVEVDGVPVNPMRYIQSANM